MGASPPSVLQVGFGGVGEAHLQAWRRLRAELWIADPEACARERAMAHLPVTRVVADYRAALDQVAVVDVVPRPRSSAPADVLAVQRDHFGGGHEDLSLILLTWPDGTVGTVESELYPARPPARHRDAERAHHTKRIEVCGSEGALEIDFQAERLVPKLEPRGPVEILASQFAEFLGWSTAPRPRPTCSAAASTSRCCCRRSPPPPTASAR